MGHILTDGGLKPDNNKLQSILDLKTPVYVAGVRGIIGMVNYLAKFLPRLADLCEPLTMLTHQDVEWIWSHEQNKALRRIKEAITQAPVL
jgi:hypothetical protein